MRTDEELLEAMRSGSEEALAELYRRHQAALFRFVVQVTGCQAVAEEAVQDAFLILIRKADAWRAERGSVRAFLYGLTRNTARRGIEDRQEFAELDFEVSGVSDVLDDLDREERVRAVREGVLTLPASYREAVVLCDMEEMSYEEAAAVMACPVGTVRSRVSRGRELLAEKLRVKLLARRA